VIKRLHQNKIVNILIIQDLKIKTLVIAKYYNNLKKKNQMNFKIIYQECLIQIIKIHYNNKAMIKLNHLIQNCNQMDFKRRKLIINLNLMMFIIFKTQVKTLRKYTLEN